MDRTHFANLIVGYCGLCRISNPMEIVHGRPVEIHRVLFSLIHSEKINPRLLLIYGDVGAVPQKGDTDAYQALLLRNFDFSAHRGPVFSISPDSGRLLLTQAEDLSELTPDRLADRLEELAEYANRWRENRLDSPGEGTSRSTTNRQAGFDSIRGVSRGLLRR